MATVHPGGVMPSGPLSKLITLPEDASNPTETSQLIVFMWPN